MFSEETIIISAAGLNFARLLGMVAEAENVGFFNRKDCKTIISTSAGCFISLLLLLNISFEKNMKELASMLNNKKFHNGSILSSLIRGITDGYILDTNLREELVNNIFNTANVSNTLTFEEAYKMFGKKLSFNTVDIETGKPHHLGYFTTPNIKIIDAILASTAIPTLFPAKEILMEDGNVYKFIDGALYNYLDLDSVNPQSNTPICKDKFYNGRSVPTGYDLAFLSYSNLDKRKSKNDMFSVMNRLLYIFQIGAIEKICTNPNIITSCSESSLSYFGELNQTKIEEEIESGKEHIRMLLKNPELLPKTLCCKI